MISLKKQNPTSDRRQSTVDHLYPLPYRSYSCRREKICRICTRGAHIQPRKHATDHADRTALTRRHELEHTGLPPKDLDQVRKIDDLSGSQKNILAQKLHPYRGRTRLSHPATWARSCRSSSERSRSSSGKKIDDHPSGRNR